MDAPLGTSSHRLRGPYSVPARPRRPEPRRPARGGPLPSPGPSCHLSRGRATFSPWRLACAGSASSRSSWPPPGWSWLPARAGPRRGRSRSGSSCPRRVLSPPTAKDMANGMQLFFEEHGWKLAGREIKLITEDDEGKPPTGLAKARSLVESQGVHVLVGPLSAAVGYAVARLRERQEGAHHLSHRLRGGHHPAQAQPYIVRTGWSSAQPSQPFGKWVYDNLGYRKIAMIGYDFAFGWEVAGGFQRTFEDAGGQVVQKLWPPLSTADFAPYLAQLRRDVDADLLRLLGRRRAPLRQAVLGGRASRASCPSSAAAPSPTSTCSAPWATRSWAWSPRCTTRPPSPHPRTRSSSRPTRPSSSRCRPTTRRVATSEVSLSRQPSRRRAATSRTSEKFLGARAPRGSVRRPRGPMRFDDYGNPVENIYVRKVERVGGQAPEHRDPHLPQRLPVLDLQARGVPQEPRLLARLPRASTAISRSPGEAVRGGLVATIGIVGLGLLGSRLSARASSRPATRWSASTSCRSRSPPSTALEARPRRPSAAVAQSAEAVCTLLPSLAAAESAILGRDGVLAGAHTGLAVIQMSTISPTLTERSPRDVSGPSVWDSSTAPSAAPAPWSTAATASSSSGASARSTSAGAPCSKPSLPRAVHVGRRGPGHDAQARRQSPGRAPQRGGRRGAHPCAQGGSRSRPSPSTCSTRARQLPPCSRCAVP